jgi:steroid delta-isomerase-like uncharacterized protein
LESGELVGPAQFHQYCTELLTAFPNLCITVDEVMAQGAAVAVRWTVTATHEGVAFGLAPTGQTFTVRGMTWVHIREGQIVEGWDALNLGGLMQKLSSQ